MALSNLHADFLLLLHESNVGGTIKPGVEAGFCLILYIFMLPASRYDIYFRNNKKNLII